jgi:2-aminoadipate transaminase
MAKSDPPDAAGSPAAAGTPAALGTPDTAGSPAAPGSADAAFSSDPLAHLYNRHARQQQASSIREICELCARPDVKSLAGGWPAPRTFPVQEVADIAQAVLAEHGALALQYGPTEGLPALRQQVLSWARDALGMTLAPEEVIITHGSQQGMDLAFRVLVEQGDVVLVGLPTYFGSTGALTTLGARPVGVPVDEEGMDAEAAARILATLQGEGARVKGIYVIPNFQNPTGATLSLSRRRRLLQLAVEHDLVVIEDDPYGELRYDGAPLPSLKALEAEQGATGRVVHLHSWSKTFAPGLRLAWAAAEPGVTRRMVVAKQYVDACTNSFGQHLALEFMRRGLLEQQIERNVAYYREKRDCLLAALGRHLPADTVRWNRPEGGLFVFAHLPAGWDADDLMREALRHRVAFISGSQFHLDGSGAHTLRLSFSQSEPDVIEAAVKRLGALVRARR